MKRIARAAVSCVLLVTTMGATASPASANHWGYDETVDRADLHQGHADVLRLYWAFFDRQPEFQGADYWIRAYNSCDWGSGRIAQFFSVSPEFEATYGELTDDEFIELVYANVFGREPDAGGAAFWLGRLSGGQTRGSLVADLSFSAEFRTAHPLPSDGVVNTGCVTDDSVIYDPVSLLIVFSEAWDTSNWDAMAAFAGPDVVNTAQEWQEAPNSGIVSAIDAGRAIEILAACGHPGSGETSCQFGVGRADGGNGLLFDFVMLDTGTTGFSAIHLAFAGDLG